MNVFVINRDDRPERWVDVQKELIQYGIKPTRFFAEITTPGWVGCRESHLSLLEQNKDEEHLLVFEDDVVFLQDPVFLMGQAFLELPSDWDCVYFGASPKEPQEKYSEHLFRLKNAHTTHAIMWNMKGEAVPYVLKHRDEIRKWDDYLASVIQPRFNYFVVFPMVATRHSKNPL